MSVTASRKLVIVQRRQRVADMYLKGHGQMAIAAELGVRQSTVCSDLKYVGTAWRESAIRDFDAARDVELERLARIEREAWAAYERSQQPAQTATVDGQAGSNSQKAKRTVRHQYGDPRFLEVILHCGEARRQLLGLDAPTKIAPTTPDGRPLTVDERRVHINAILVEHFGVAAVALSEHAGEETSHETQTVDGTVGADDGRRIVAPQSTAGAGNQHASPASEAS